MFETKDLPHTSDLNTIIVPHYKGFDHALHYILTENGEKFVDYGCLLRKRPAVATETALNYWHKKFVTLIGKDFDPDTMYVYETHIDAEKLFEFLTELYNSEEGKKLMGGYMTIGSNYDDEEDEEDD